MMKLGHKKINTHIYLLDFNDSYTFNIVSDWWLILGENLTVVPLEQHENVLHQILHSVASKANVDHAHSKNTHGEKLPELLGIILGPGPGHPKDYKNIFPYLYILLQKNIPMLGICLGHQILASMFHARIKRSLFPMHGRQEKIKMNHWWQQALKIKKNILKVQRYNSLTVTVDKKFLTLMAQKKAHLLYALSGECMGIAHPQFLSWQFHPESVGTVNKKIFFNFMHHFFVHKSFLG